MKFLRYGSKEVDQKDLKMCLYYLLILLKLVHVNEEPKVRFVLNDDKHGEWEISFKQLKKPNVPGEDSAETKQEL